MAEMPGTLGQWLEAEMDRRGCTAGQVATYAKLSPQTISNVRAGKNVSLETLVALSQWSGADVEELKRLARWSPVKHRRPKQAVSQPAQYLVTNPDIALMFSQWEELVGSGLTTEELASIAAAMLDFYDNEFRRLAGHAYNRGESQAT